MNDITFELNHEQVTITADPSLRLLDVLRDRLHLTGAKEGCGEGECGACSVLINDQLANSCLVPLANVHKQRVTTIEGIAATKEGKLLQQAYSKEGAVQCGICTPGMMMASYALLKKHPHPTREQIQIGLSGNLCRCTGYNMIFRAIERAAKEGEGTW